MDKFNSLASGRYNDIFKSVSSTLNFQTDTFSTNCQIALRRTPQNPSDNKPALVQAMALVPSGIKPLLEPILTYIYVAIWHHWATMSWICMVWFICKRHVTSMPRYLHIHYIYFPYNNTHNADLILVIPWLDAFECHTVLLSEPCLISWSRPRQGIDH